MKDKNSSQVPLWTGSFVKICLVNFFIFVNFHALLPTFPFFVTHLGGDSVAIGLATALFSLASIISRPFLGWFIDTKGRCTILVLGLIGMALIPMGYFVSAGIAFAVILRTIHGAFHAASSNASSTWVTDIIPHSRMGEGLGMYGLSMALSTAIAPALGLAVMNKFGFNLLFVVTTLAAVVALVLGVSIKKRDYKLSTQPLRIKDLFEKMSLPAAITQFFFMMTYGVVEVYVAIYATTYHLPSGGVYFIFIAIATVLTRVFMGRTVEKRGEGIMVYTGLAAIMIGIVLLVLAHNMPCYLLSALLLGYSFGAIQPSLQTMAMHAVSSERRGAANSTFFVAFDLGIALGGFLAGLLVKYFGYNVMFLVIGGSCVLALIYYFFFGRNHASSLNQRNRKQAEEVASILIEDKKLPLIITISREYGSGGHRIGELLAQKLGVKLYDRDLIALTSKTTGISENVVAESEQMVDGKILYDDPVQTAMFEAQSRVICEVAQRESCVIVGRLANFILKGKARCFNLFIYADPEYRESHIVNEYHVDKSIAKATMQDIDRKRKGHCLHYTGQEWGDYHHYDLMVDSSLLNQTETVEMIYNTIKPLL